MWYLCRIRRIHATQSYSRTPVIFSAKIFSPGPGSLVGNPRREISYINCLISLIKCFFQVPTMSFTSNIYYWTCLTRLVCTRGFDNKPWWCNFDVLVGVAPHSSVIGWEVGVRRTLPFHWLLTGSKRGWLFLRIIDRTWSMWPTKQKSKHVEHVKRDHWWQAM